MPTAQDWETFHAQPQRVHTHILVTGPDGSEYALCNEFDLPKFLGFGVSAAGRCEPTTLGVLAIAALGLGRDRDVHQALIEESVQAAARLQVSLGAPFDPSALAAMEVRLLARPVPAADDAEGESSDA